MLDLAERAAVHTRQLLAFARKPPLLPRPTSMDQLLRSTAEFISRTLRVTVSVEPAPSDGISLVAEVDTSQLQQALVNLALNARDAMPEGAPILFRLRHEQIEQQRPAFPDTLPPGDYVVMEVADSGCGMTPEVLNQALDPFFTTKDVGQGTGLGLPVVFGIVHAHHGFLTIESAPNQGTRVAIFLSRWQERSSPASGGQPQQPDLRD